MKKWLCSIIIVFIICIVNMPLYSLNVNADEPTNNMNESLSSSADIDDSTDSTVFVVSIPGLSFQEIDSAALQEYPQLFRLTEQGRIGAMNIRTRFKGIEDSYLTLGAGAFASSYNAYYGMHGDELKLGERADVLYRRYLGMDSELGMTSAEIIIPEIPAIQQLNVKSNYHAKPGLLGDTLKRAGISVSVWGNRDRGLGRGDISAEEVRKRAAPLMVMNGQGQVEGGAIDEKAMIINKERPYGAATNYAWILEQLKKSTKPAINLIELGDLDRLYEEKHLYSEAQFKQLKSTILREMDGFIGHVIHYMRAVDTLLIFSPQVHQDATSQKSLFSPLISYQLGSEPGLIISGTTRREGIVSILDIAPTLLNIFDLTVPEDMIGFPIEYEAKQDALAWLDEELAETQKTYRLRPKLLYSFVIYQMIVMLLGLFFAFLKPLWSMKWMTVPLISVLIAPIVLLRLQWLYSFSNLVIIILFFTMIIAAGLILYRIPLYKALGITSLVTVFILLLDGLLGAEWMKRSVLGYDPMVGARYYGMGNEYMGILIGAAILLVSVGLHYFQSNAPKITLISSSLLFLVIILYLGSPQWGTNAGGAITAVIAFGIAWIRMFGGRILSEIRWHRLFLFVFLLGMAAVIGLWLLNHLFISVESEQSHIGRSMQLILDGKLNVVGGIVVRKLIMNWHLIVVSAWSKVLITSLFVMAVIVLRPRGVFSTWQRTIPLIMYGFSANTIGSIIVLFVNDSGIVAAATMIIYAAIPMLLIKHQESSASHSS